MGLCKCERKKVTTLFCFEHRVNVCEFCLVSGHPKCVVKSYLQWLKDSDYNPVCTICNTSLSDGSMECVRLVCLDVFHLSCLNELASKYPPTTAPAGYECPSCRQYIIPQPNQGGPVAEALRCYLSTADWAKSVFKDSADDIIPTSQPQLYSLKDQNKVSIINNQTENHQVNVSPNKLLDYNLDVAASQFLQDNRVYPNITTLPQTGIVNGNVPAISVSDSKSCVNTFHQHQINQTYSGRMQPSVSGGLFIGNMFDEDDKYKRRNALSWLARLLESNFGIQSCSSMPSSLQGRRILLYCLVAMFFIITIFGILNRLAGDTPVTGDPLLDLNMNPNIRVDNDQKIIPVNAELLASVTLPPAVDVENLDGANHA